MPFIKPHAGDDGGEHPDAYWTPTDTEFHWDSEVARVVWRGYHDAAFWSSGGKPIDGAIKEYLFSGDAFRAMAPAYLSGAIPPAVLVDQIALDTPDVPAPTEDDPDRMVSFFDASVSEQVPFPGMG